MEILASRQNDRDYMAAREAAEVAEAVQESNPNDYSNERGYANYGNFSMGAYDQANVSSNAMALQESQPVEADSSV